MSLPLNINFGQILLHMFNLVLLFGGLYLLLYKPVKKFMDGRALKYATLQKTAEEKLAAAQAAEDNAAKKLADAGKEISEKSAKAKIEAEKEAEAIINKANEQKKKMLADAEEAALRDKKRIIDDAREEIALLAVKAAEKVLMEKTGKSEKTDA
ncbi:MAG: ATP synthase F0 subunit B [Clostridia bacterium]|nr:ATP synthase F0 subunit B [Clostridia bacterium]